MKKDFSFYEFTGVLLPGSTLLFGVIWLFPEAKDVLLGKDLSLGALGLFVIAAYLSGHLIQSLGNGLESTAWWFTGKPTHWISWKKPPFLSDTQHDALPAMLKTQLGDRSKNLKELSKRDTNAIRGQLYSKLKKDGRTGRIDIINGNYGMFRGIAAAALVIATTTLFVNGSLKPWANTYIALSVFFLASYRCYRFGVHYASELYWQSLDLYRDTKPSKKTK